MIKLVSDTIDKDDIKSLVEWLTQSEIPKLTKGELTWELESKWANKINTKYSVFVNSGSSAILLCLAALKHTNRLKNNKIIVPGLSWATDVSSPILLGLQPILCDCNLYDLSCDLQHLENLFIKESPSAFILVSPLGLVPDMENIINLCKKYDVILLEDVCESLGSKFNNQYLGSFGFASFFSTYFGHHLSTIEGGFINTNDKDFYYALLMMRSHGWDRDLPKHMQNKLRNENNINEFDSLYTFYLPGFNVRSTDLQAFIGLRAIDKLDKYSQIRNINFKQYKKTIKYNKINIVEQNECFISNFAYPIIDENRNEIVNRLLNNNIEIRPLIAGDMSKKPMWTKTYGKVSLPNCEIVDKYGFYIPNHQDLTFKNIENIISLINE
jgi:CDP-6-deoxy-D-xylo-4-hexulose-3-dehydrase